MEDSLTYSSEFESLVYGGGRVDGLKFRVYTVVEREVDYGGECDMLYVECGLWWMEG